MARPTKKSTPAVWRFWVSDLIGPAKVSAAEPGPSRVTMSVTFWVVVTGSPNRPTRETMASSAGNSESSP